MGLIGAFVHCFGKIVAHAMDSERSEKVRG